jgi:hypothetical protein
LDCRIDVSGGKCHLLCHNRAGRKDKNCGQNQWGQHLAKVFSHFAPSFLKKKKFFFFIESRDYISDVKVTGVLEKP